MNSHGSCPDCAFSATGPCVTEGQCVSSGNYNYDSKLNDNYYDVQPGEECDIKVSKNGFVRTWRDEDQFRTDEDNDVLSIDGEEFSGGGRWASSASWPVVRKLGQGVAVTTETEIKWRVTGWDRHKTGWKICYHETLPTPSPTPAPTRRPTRNPTVPTRNPTRYPTTEAQPEESDGPSKGEQQPSPSRMQRQPSPYGYGGR